MTARRIVTCLLASIALFLSPPVSSQAQDNAAQSECIKGTVVKVADTALHLKNTTFPDETLGSATRRSCSTRPPPISTAPRR